METQPKVKGKWGETFKKPGEPLMKASRNRRRLKLFHNEELRKTRLNMMEPSLETKTPPTFLQLTFLLHKPLPFDITIKGRFWLAEIDKIINHLSCSSNFQFIHFRHKMDTNEAGTKNPKIRNMSRTSMYSRLLLILLKYYKHNPDMWYIFILFILVWINSLSVLPAVSMKSCQPQQKHDEKRHNQVASRRSYLLWFSLADWF